MSMVGDTVTLDQLIALATAVTGRKPSVTVLTQEDLEARLAESVDIRQRLWTEFNLAYTRDLEGEAVLRPVVNELCPDVKPIGVGEYLEESWNVYQQSKASEV